MKNNKYVDMPNSFGESSLLAFHAQLDIIACLHLHAAKSFEIWGEPVPRFDSKGRFDSLKQVHFQVTFVGIRLQNKWSMESGVMSVLLRLITELIFHPQRAIFPLKPTCTTSYLRISAINQLSTSASY